MRRVAATAQCSGISDCTHPNAATFLPTNFNHKKNIDNDFQELSIIYKNGKFKRKARALKWNRGGWKYLGMEKRERRELRLGERNAERGMEEIDGEARNDEEEGALMAVEITDLNSDPERQAIFLAAAL
ncbi:hypothetical protein FNV43_RR18492 [Rhamnella rubrinervis]|uniref:Uncharacterized protein n=1 Tax=Rhamnella rubrinervis TaxID=2594499 RepID=A0A8K0GUI5_9ROSA|nr:hypothetical protein FNV43_RR17109 [Rhamnella rubrinervis]KAF3440209.1 hypothetical protein FNV43_RR18492 [Rhamnella rubrinervis]